MFLLFIITVSITTALLPAIAPYVLKALGYEIKSGGWMLPLVASCLFFTSFYLPDIHISSQTSTFQQHFVGGGIYSALLYFYIKRIFSWRFSLVIDLLLLFAWTSALGVANKLLEFVLLKLHLLALDTTDAYWDLLANTLGAYTAYILFMMRVALGRSISSGRKHR